MKTKTITFDPAQYKLVPIEPTEEMIHAPYGDDEINKLTFQEMLVEVPTTLPGVAEHSGEPCGWRKFETDECDENYTAYSDDEPKVMGRWEPVFDHPPAQAEQNSFVTVKNPMKTRIDVPGTKRSYVIDTEEQQDTEALSDQDAFETWSKREGWCNLAPAINGTCEDGRFPATYHYAPTETAWRAWANKPNADTAALQARIAELERIEFVAVPLGQSKVFLEQENRISELTAQTKQEPNYVLRFADQLHGPLGDTYGLILVSDWNVGLSRFCADRVCDSNKSPLIVYAAPDNPLVIVQAALDAAAQVCDDSGWQPSDPEQMERQKCVAAIRAINPQTILDGMTK